MGGSSFPDQTGNNGKILGTNGTAPSWVAGPTGTLPSQTNQSGNLLTTDGSNAAWANGVSRVRILNNEETPDYSLFQWYAALAKANSVSPKVLAIGDSITQGLNVTSPTVNAYFALLKNRTASMYPPKGEGLQYFPATAQACTWGSCTWAKTGTWTALPSWGLTIAPAKVWSAGSSATATLTSAYFDSIDIYYLTNTDSGSGFTVAIDGGATTTYGASTTSSPAWVRQNVTATLGKHSVVFTAPSSGNMYLYAVALNVSGTGGVQWNNASVSGSSASHWCTNPSASQNSGWMTVMPAPSLIIEALGTNDYGGGSSATWQTNLDACLTFLAATFPTAAVLVVDMQNTSGATGFAGEARSVYYAVTKAEAAKFGAAYLNIGDRWGTYATATAAGILFDGLHPNIYGHWDIADYLLKRLFPTSWYPASTNSPAYNATISNGFGCSANSPAPTITLGAAANSTTTISAVHGPSPTGGPCDFSGEVQINTTCSSCSAGTASQEFFRVTFGTPRAGTPICTLSPSGAQSAALSGTSQVYPNYQNSSGTYASFYAGSTKPPDNQFMLYNWHCDGQ
jgi:lysophospholipase L1-like esterase